MDIAQNAGATPQPQPKTLPKEGHPGGWSGTVKVDGKDVQVTGGAVEFEGQHFIVSDDGKYVIDLEQHLVGIIQNGVFIPVTPELIDQLQQQGVFGNEQPQGTPPQTPQ